MELVSRRSLKIIKILLIFTFCLISAGGAVIEVKGYLEGGVLIKWKYEAKYTQNPKYFCKGSWLHCSVRIETKGKNMWETSGRFSVFDDAKSAEFWVMMRDLTVQDIGTYQFRVSEAHFFYTTVELKLKKGSFYSREVIAYAGTRSNIKCRYEDEYKNNSKSFLKIETDQWSIKHISTEPKQEWSHDGRFSIHDNRSAGFFSVFIREMITEDTGTYACAVAASDETEIYTLLNLNVTEDISFEKSISESAHVGQDVTISCTYPESHRNDNKFLCKRPYTAACIYTATIKESKKVVRRGKLTLYDDREKNVFTVSLRNVTEQDSGEYWCGAEVAWKKDHGFKVYFTHVNLTITVFPVSIAIILPVVFLVLLAGISFLIVTLWKRRKKQGQERSAQAFRWANGDDPDIVYEMGNSNIYQFDPIYENLN